MQDDTQHLSLSSVDEKKIAIIGAGPGGLMMARLLQQSGARVALFHANFNGWSELWVPLFRQAASMVWRPLLTCPSDQHWDPKPNVTLIGDAAHVMPPYAGEGVNMAMLDALVLSRLLLNEKSSSSAIAIYEAGMFARMRHMTEDTMVNTEMFYATDAADRVASLFRSFGGTEAAPPTSEV